jgi:hypothetical protein
MLLRLSVAEPESTLKIVSEGGKPDPQALRLHKRQARREARLAHDYCADATFGASE